MANLGEMVGKFLGFDPTPGFNLGYTTSGGNFQPRIVGPGVNPRAPKENSTSKTPQKGANKPITNNTQRTSNSSSSAYSAPAEPDYDPADLAYLDDQEARLRGQKSSASRTLKSGIAQLGDSYNKEVSGANKRRSDALEDFAVQREDTTRDKDRALNTVDTNARTLADSLRLKLGMAAGSNSSAYQLAAPAAVNRQASTQRTGVVENYGENFRDMATNEERAKTAFEDLLEDLESERKTKESDFRSGILDKENQIDTALSEVARQRALLKGGGYDKVKQAMQPYSADISARQAEIDSLFDKFRTPFSVKPVDVSKPELRDYTVDRGTIGEGQTASEDPYAAYLRKKQEEQVTA